ncbi:Ku protein [Silvibacterium sp.]|uniref:non-homologous end joining protein Ku n=1 Tax=Silvibacterium sp. TaxID=1964179 RepID=UPI0039E5AAD3
MESNRHKEISGVARAYWSGQLQISLVSFDIELFPAVNSASEIAFHQIDRNTGERVRHMKVIDGNDPVEKAEIVKGYEYRPGKYVTIEPEEIDRLRIESKRRLEVAQFVDLAEIPLTLFEKPYFVVPGGKEQAQAFAVVQRALAKSGKAGLGEIVFAGREHLVAITAAPGEKSRGMMIYTLRYGTELRDEDQYFGNIGAQTVDAKQLSMATDLIEQYTQPFNLAEFHDDYEDAVKKLVEAKVKKQPLPLDEDEKKPAKGKVINLMDALRASLNAQSAGKKKSPAKKTAAKRVISPKAAKRAPAARRKSA